MMRGQASPNLTEVEATGTDFSPDGVPRCGACSDVLGVYEPIVCVMEGTARHTSRAAEPLLARSGQRCYHLGCYQSLDAEL
jgi:hypothetical protein